MLSHDVLLNAAPFEGIDLPDFGGPGALMQQASAASGGTADAGATSDGASSAGGGSKPNDDAVDAEFEEVKDKKKAS